MSGISETLASEISVDHSRVDGDEIGLDTVRIWIFTVCSWMFYYLNNISMCIDELIDEA